MSLNIAKIANRFSMLHPLPTDLQGLVDEIQKERAAVGPGAVVQVPVTPARLVAVWAGVWQAASTLALPKSPPGPAPTPVAAPSPAPAPGTAPAPGPVTGPVPGPTPGALPMPSSDLSLTLMLLAIAQASHEAQVVLHMSPTDMSLWSVALHALVEICLDDEDCNDPTAIPAITPFRAANGCCGPLPDIHKKGIDLSTFDKIKPATGQRRMFVNAGTVDAFLASGGSAPLPAAPPAAPVATPPSP